MASYPMVTMQNRNTRMIGIQADSLLDIYNENVDTVTYANEELYNEDYLY